MIDLTKPDEKATINLSKDDDKISVTAEWRSTTGSRDNTDLDLRAAVLLPDGRVFLIDGEQQGTLDHEPFVYHHGDVLSAGPDEPGREYISVARDIAKKAGGPVGLAFSIYSALDNGDVPVAALKPIMRIAFGSQVVNCKFDFSSIAGGAQGVYTYVIGYATVTEDQVVLAPSGKVGRRAGEETAWPRWSGSDLLVEVDGPAVFKGAASKSKRYNNENGITKRFANINEGGFLSRLYG